MRSTAIWVTVSAAVVCLTACGPATGRTDSSAVAGAVAPGAAAAAAFAPKAPAAIATVALATATPGVAPTAPPVAAPTSLLAYTNNSATRFTHIDGKLVGSLDDNAIYFESPLASGLLAAHHQSGGNWDVDALDYVTSDGNVERVATVKPGEFRDAIGNPSAMQFAWLVGGDQSGCGGQPSNAGTDVFLGTKPGEANLVAHLPSLTDHVQWTFFQWTGAGIVLREGTPPGCGMGPRVNLSATDLLNPATGSVTSLAPKLGANCPLQSMADNGEMVCYLIDRSTATPAPVTNATAALRLIAPGGTATTMTVGQLGGALPCDGGPMTGDVAMSADGRYVTFNQVCYPTADGAPSTGRLAIYSIATHAAVTVAAPAMPQTVSIGQYPNTTTKVVSAPAVYSVAAWLPDGHLIAVADADTSRTVAINPDGSSTTIVNADIDFASVFHI